MPTSNFKASIVHHLRSLIKSQIFNIVDSDPLVGKKISLRRGVDLQICYSQGQNPAIVFLHGGLGNRYNWRSQYEFFQSQGQAVLAFDLAGHGQSSPYKRYSLGRHERDLSRLLHHFHIDAPVLCCHSYGVPLGLEWARKHPVSALVFIGGGTHDLDPWWEIPLMKFQAWIGRYFYRLPIVQRLTHAVSSTHKHQVIQRFFAESPIPVELHPYQALKIFWGYNFFRRHGTSWLPNIPVLVISGGQDPMFTAQMGEELATYFPQGRHLHLHSAGHLVMAEYPAEINQAIAALVKTLI